MENCVYAASQFLVKTDHGWSCIFLIDSCKIVIKSSNRNTPTAWAFWGMATGKKCIPLLPYKRHCSGDREKAWRFSSFIFPSCHALNRMPCILELPVLQKCRTITLQAEWFIWNLFMDKFLWQLARESNSPVPPCLRIKNEVGPHGPHIMQFSYGSYNSS